MKVISLHNEQNQLISMALENNRHAQQKIYTLYCKKMLAVCHQYVKDIHQAEDVMITAFMKVFTSINAFENKGSFEGWIRKIMVNESISFLRVNKKVSFIEDEFFVELAIETDENDYSVEQILLLIDSLPEGYKMVFNLYAIEGYKHNEIAKMLQINEGTSKSQLSHARKMLQTKIYELNQKENGTQ